MPLPKNKPLGIRPPPPPPLPRPDNPYSDIRSALAFYADPQNYVQRPIGYSLASPVELDQGTLARIALNK